VVKPGNASGRASPAAMISVPQRSAPDAEAVGELASRHGE
jgi:hypothetical protein